MTTLTAEQIGRLTLLLAQRDAALHEDLRRELALKEDYLQVASEVPDQGDASFADLTVDLGNAAVMRDLRELRAIQTARQRIETGRYGECLHCGYEIPFERLLVQPTAERCAPCQNVYERTHGDGLRSASY